MEKQKLKSLLSFLESFSNHYKSSSKVVILPNPQFKLVNIFHNQGNLKENVYHTHISQYIYNQNNSLERINSHILSESFPICSYSPSYKYRALIQNIPDKQDKSKIRNTLEIYRNETLFRTLNLDEFHEKIIQNDMVGEALIWNKDETKLAYIASLKPEKKNTYFEFFANGEINDTQLESAKDYQRYESDYGEKLVNIFKTTIFIYDLQNHTLNQLILPYDNLFPTHPIFPDNEGNSLIFCGFLPLNGVKLGILHCMNREARIFKENNPKLKKLFPKEQIKTGEEEKKDEKIDINQLNCISKNFDTNLKPFLSPDGKKIAYFSTPLKPPHLNYLSLVIYDIETEKEVIILPIIEKNIFNEKSREIINKENNNSVFPGIVGFYDNVENSFWLTNNHIIFSSTAGFEVNIYLVDIIEKNVAKLSPNVSELISTNWRLLNKNSFDLFISYENIKHSILPKIANITNLKQLIESGSSVQEISKSAEWKFTQIKSYKDEFESTIEEIFEKKLIEKRFVGGNAEGIFWTLDNYNENSKEFKYLFKDFNKEETIIQDSSTKPLIVFLHGGPHGNGTGVSKLRAFLLLRGYNLFIPNYTGSSGYGQTHLESLNQYIGIKDVEEIIQMLNKLIDEKLVDPSKIGVMGGSYGGYLSGIFACHPKYSNYFKCAILLNPVLNIPFTTNISDIPEWCSAVSFGKISNWNYTPEDYAKMFQLSPMANKCNIPCLLLLGAKDKRVPYQAGLAFEKKCKMDGADIENFVYPESDHGLGETIGIEFDIYVRILSYLEKKLF